MSQPNYEDARRLMLEELKRCSDDPAHFIHTYTKIYDPEAKGWIPFHLWPAQREVSQLTDFNKLLAVLKARQVGLTWFYLGRILHQMLFRSVAKPLVFSRREEDAIYLLGSERLRGMYKELPSWLVKLTRGQTTGDAARTWTLENGSTAHCFPINAGDSYTSTFVLMDEFDLLSEVEQNRLLRSVKPTIDAGGTLVLLSRSDKTKPESEFKKIYRAAKAGEDGCPWKSIFLPWYVHPGRDQDWYERQKADSLARTGFLDDLYEQYPTTDAECLAPKSQDKRIPAAWLVDCFKEEKPLSRAALKQAGTPAIPDLQIFKLPEVFKSYVLGADPAEGNPTSDASAAVVLDLESGEQVALLAGRIQPTPFSEYIAQIAEFYNRASLLVERNNHGAAVLSWLEQNSSLTVLMGEDKKPGWLSHTRGKALLYNTACDAFRDGATTIHTMSTFAQLCSIEDVPANRLRAPEGQHDDEAVAYVLALQAMVQDALWYSPGCLRD